LLNGELTGSLLSSGGGIRRCLIVLSGERRFFQRKVIASGALCEELSGRNGSWKARPRPPRLRYGGDNRVAQTELESPASPIDLRYGGTRIHHRSEIRA
jgi:hypothetical protein